MNGLEFRRGNPAIVTELYLPKKYTSNLAFRTLLENLLLPDKVKMYFANLNYEEVRHSLPQQLTESKAYTDLRNKLLAEGQSRTFTGYSIYDLDGAFRDDRTPTLPGVGPAIDYDASACVRIVDTIDVKKVYQFVGVKAEHEQGRVWRIIRILLPLRLHHIDKDDVAMLFRPDELETVHRVIEYINDWSNEGSFLLYGFLLHEAKKIAKSERAIMLTSHFAIVNQYE